jgi:predicted nucleic acid-binding Zn ribbon protein
MPLYTFECTFCRRRKDEFLKIEDRNTLYGCGIGHPSAPMKRVITGCQIRPDYPGYSCPVTGAWIEGRRAHEANLRKHDARVLEPGETQAAFAAKRQEEAAFDQSVGHAFDSTFDALPPAKREQFALEVASGADLAINRAGKAL